MLSRAYLEIVYLTGLFPGQKLGMQSTGGKVWLTTVKLMILDISQLPHEATRNPRQ
jgi:hypothetical protein